MAIQVPVAGLDRFMPAIQGGEVVLLEGGIDPSKSFLAARLGAAAAAAGRSVTFISTRGRTAACRYLDDTPGGDAVDVAEAVAWSDVGLPARGDRDLVVDAFSVLVLDSTPAEVGAVLLQIRDYAIRSERAVVLVNDEGMLGPRRTAVLHHMADGIVRFCSREDSEGAMHYLRVAKWPHAGAAANNIYYSFDGRHLLIDTRKRLA